MAWFRFYAETLDDPKVQRLSNVAFKTWCNIMALQCRCNADGEEDLPDVEDIAFALRMSEDDLVEVLKELARPYKDQGALISFDGKSVKITAWDKRQFRSDNSTERSRRHREKKKQEAQQGGRSTQRECNVAATPPETETDTETDRGPHTRKRGVRIPDDFPSSQEISWATKTLKVPKDVAEREAQKFRRYFTGPDCKRPARKDWPRTWQNWWDNVNDWSSGSARGQPQGDDATTQMVEAMRNRQQLQGQSP